MTNKTKHSGKQSIIKSSAATKTFIVLAIAVTTVLTECQVKIFWNCFPF